MTDWIGDETRQIVVGFDSDWQSRQWLLDRAAQEAQRRDVALTLVTVRPSRRAPDPGLTTDPSDDPGKALTDAASPSEGVEALRLMYPLLSIRGLLLDEDELSQDRAPLRGTELLILGSRSRSGHPAFAKGSMSQVLLEALGCPVLLIPAGHEHRGNESWPVVEPFVLAGIGTDSEDVRVAGAGMDEAARRGCDLHLLFSHPVVPGRLDHAELSRPWDLVRAAAAGPDSSTPRLSVILTSETPADALLHHAVNATVVVIGARPGSLLGLVDDSVSHAVLTAIRCPVLVIPREDETPRSSIDGPVVADLRTRSGLPPLLSGRSTVSGSST